MKKIFLITAACAAITITSCGGNQSSSIPKVGGDSIEALADSSQRNTDTTINATDTTSTGTDHSATGGTSAVGSNGADTASKK